MERLLILWRAPWASTWRPKRCTMKWQKNQGSPQRLVLWKNPDRRAFVLRKGCLCISWWWLSQKSGHGLRIIWGTDHFNSLRVCLLRGTVPRTLTMLSHLIHQNPLRWVTWYLFWNKETTGPWGESYTEVAEPAIRTCTSLKSMHFILSFAAPCYHPPHTQWEVGTQTGML